MLQKLCWRRPRLMCICVRYTTYASCACRISNPVVLACLHVRYEEVLLFVADLSFGASRRVRAAIAFLPLRAWRLHRRKSIVPPALVPFALAPFAFGAHLSLLFLFIFLLRSASCRAPTHTLTERPFSAPPSTTSTKVNFTPSFHSHSHTSSLSRLHVTVTVCPSSDAALSTLDHPADALNQVTAHLNASLNAHHTNALDIESSSAAIILEAIRGSSPK